MSKKEFDVEILPDGTVKVDFGDMGGEHHLAADQFLAMIKNKMGGTVTVANKRAQGTHSHHHDHGHEHGHDHTH